MNPAITVPAVIPPKVTPPLKKREFIHATATALLADEVEKYPAAKANYEKALADFEKVVKRVVRKRFTLDDASVDIQNWGSEPNVSVSQRLKLPLTDPEIAPAWAKLKATPYPGRAPTFERVLEKVQIAFAQRNPSSDRVKELLSNPGVSKQFAEFGRALLSASDKANAITVS